MRSRVERIVRTVAWITLAGATGLAWRSPVVPATRAVSSPPSVETLARWALVPPADSLIVTFRGLPGDTMRSQVAAIAGAGIAVQWRDDGVDAQAGEVELDVSTGRGALRVAGGPVEVSDAAGALGVVDGALVVPGLVLPVRAGVVPSAELVPSRRALVLGTPSWESGWIVRGLEAAGWSVEARFVLAPGLVAGPSAIDTATFAVAIVLDRVEPVMARALLAFVRSGGGLVLGPGALGAPVLAQIAPGAVAALARSAASLALPTDRADLAFRPVVRLRADAVALDTARIAARREGQGRVVLIGDVETWRWALASDPGRTAHSAFWVRVVEAARYRPLGDRMAGDPAPRASLVAAFGPPVQAPAPALPRWPWEAMLFVLGMAGLMTEWASRRMRGAV
ncbi:MAG: hypothetical protein WD934_06755 [Gemmatimonadales bacterium]